MRSRSAPLLAPALALLMLMTGCASFDPNNVLFRALPPAESEATAAGQPLTLPQRQQALDYVWTTINERYYDARLNGVDWRAARTRFEPRVLAAADDERFWDELDKLTGELKDSHTRVESPKRVEARQRQASVTLGLSMSPIEGALVLTSVNPQSDAWWAGARPGMRILTIDGMPATAAYDKLYQESRDSSSLRARALTAIGSFNRGEPGTTVTMSFARADGSEFAATLKRARIASPAQAQHRVMPSGFGYLRFSNFSAAIAPQVREGLAALRSTPGIIVDLRGNGGGSHNLAIEWLGHFFKERTLLSRQLTRDGKPISLAWGLSEVVKMEYHAPGNPDAYLGPVVVLINEGSGSGSEYFAATLKAEGRARILGRQSCGCLLGFLGYANIPGGGQLAYSEMGMLTSKGERIERDGVTPDLQIPLSQADLLAGRDRTLEVAQEELAKLAAKTKPAA